MTSNSDWRTERAAERLHPMGEQRSIAVIAPNWLGDAVMSLPLVGMLGASPAVDLAVIAPEATGRVYWELPEVAELVVLPKRTATRGVRARARHLGQTRPDAAIVLPPSFSSAAGAWLARVPLRVGYRCDGRGGLLTEAVDANGARDEHLTRNYIRLGEVALEKMEIETPKGAAVPQVRVGAFDHAQLESRFEAAVSGEPYAVVVPGATYGPAKSWPWRRYRELARALSADITVALAGTRAEREKCERIGEGLENVRNLAGETSLGAFLSLLSRASVVVANDSGSPHLAASMGTPVVVLFGSTSPRWTAPVGPSVDIVRHPVSCSPCFRRTCPTHLECFDGISVREVLDRVLARVRD
jgi:heptosyltransferase-2